MSDQPIRMGMRHDALNVEQMTRAAHPRMPDELVGVVAGLARDGRADSTVTRFRNNKTGEVIEGVRFLHSLRVLGRIGQQARAFVFAAPPLEWIIAQGKDSGASIADRVALAGALAELQLIGTMPRYQRRGYASALMADAEDRYRAAGYRALIAILNENRPDLVDWYRRRGYTVGEPDVPAMVQLYGDRMHTPAHYDHLIPGQRTAVKALADDVAVTRLGSCVHVRALIHEYAAAVNTDGADDPDGARPVDDPVPT